MSESKRLIHDRQEKLKNSIKKAGLDAVVINPSPNLNYLTGLHFHLSERPVILIFPAVGFPAIVLPELETAKIQESSFHLQGFPYGEDPSSWPNVFGDAFQYIGQSDANIGYEQRALRLLEFNLINQAVPNGKFSAADKIISTSRMYKDPAEIKAMRKAVKIAEAALKTTLPKIKIGITELEIAKELALQLLHHGSNPRLPFFPIVSGGPNSANPHAAPSDRRLADGDLLVIDYGANVNDYLSDITRTFAIGDVDPEYKKIAQIVLEANQAGHAAAKPGVPLGDVDKAAREVIKAAGYGKYFIHRTGHGLGLEGHEAPYIRSDNSSLIEPGMTFTIEPGIYIPDRGGVRIEDDVFITESGCESLTNLPRDLMTIG
jgi:Xaa-Pro dipeptidase